MKNHTRYNNKEKTAILFNKQFAAFLKCYFNHLTEIFKLNRS
ncbi:hypothetical protein SB48_HM08orf00886 [Heyndrickxia coagulans]|uniref:Transposase n=1 Tax=Heyndrickxia coagulans TaxID=1398 RepID=A0AAN0WAI3_HEYCO|nr:hypothetical protein SB48_HM08orf00886 [Heyndrickxia coagulans]